MVINPTSPKIRTSLDSKEIKNAERSRISATTNGEVTCLGITDPTNHTLGLGLVVFIGGGKIILFSFKHSKCCYQP